jgi:hypothetical protein
MRLIAAAVVTTDIVSFNALAISKIQVHRDRGNEFADRRRFALAANIEDYLGNPQSPRQRGTKVTFEEGPVLAQSGHSLERRDQAKPNCIAISIHMSWQVYSEWRAIGASLRI